MSDINNQLYIVSLYNTPLIYTDIKWEKKYGKHVLTTYGLKIMNGRIICHTHTLSIICTIHEPTVLLENRRYNFYNNIAIVAINNNIVIL